MKRIDYDKLAFNIIGVCNNCISFLLLENSDEILYKRLYCKENKTYCTNVRDSFLACSKLIEKEIPKKSKSTNFFTRLYDLFKKRK